MPRFHITWGTGPGVVAPFERRVRAHEAGGRLRLAFRHRVSRLLTTAGRVTGVAGEVLADDGVARGERSSRDVVDTFEYAAGAVIPPPSAAVF